jgi:plasmid replication initiation protein
MTSPQPSKTSYELAMPEEANDRYVSMSNRLARSAQGLNLAEKRLISLCLSETDSVPQKKLFLATNAGWKVKVTALAYAEAFDVHPTTAYEQLKSGAHNLFDRYVRYEIRGRQGKSQEVRFRWVSGAIYAEGEGAVELNFSPEIAPHLLGLRKQFTSYKLVHASAFDSVYAWRLYEILKSWQSTGLYRTSIEDFWEAMEAPPSCRKDFKALRLRVIEPALEAINTKAGLNVVWTPVRKGARRVTALEFRVTIDPQAKLDMGWVDGMGDLDDIEDDIRDEQTAASDAQEVQAADLKSSPSTGEDEPSIEIDGLSKIVGHRKIASD